MATRITFATSKINIFSEFFVFSWTKTHFFLCITTNKHEKLQFKFEKYPPVWPVHITIFTLRIHFNSFLFYFEPLLDAIWDRESHAIAYYTLLLSLPLPLCVCFHTAHRQYDLLLPIAVFFPTMFMTAHEIWQQSKMASTLSDRDGYGCADHMRDRIRMKCHRHQFTLHSSIQESVLSHLCLKPNA